MLFSLNQLKKYYTASPQWMKKLYASIPFDIRNGREYRRWKRFLHEDISVEEYEFMKLKESINYAYKYSRYYNTLFKNMGASPDDIKTYKDFQKIPFVDKDIIRNNFEDFVIRDYPRHKVLSVATGGSSGTPVEFIQSKNIWSKELAIYMNYFEQHNFFPSSLKATFKGGDFKNLPQDIYWFYNPVNNEVNFSPVHLSKKTVYKYVEYLNSLKPRFIHAYPSSMIFLLTYMQECHLKLDFEVDTVFLISESFAPMDIIQISDFFDCEVAATYGHTERLVFAESIGDAVLGYQINRRYGYFELIDENGRIIESTQKRGEIVGTGFDNYAMPILRYKTGDYSSYIDAAQKIINLVDSPRKQLYIDDKYGNSISRPTLLRQTELFKMGVIKYQIIQKNPGKIQILMIVNKSFNKNTYSKLQSILDQRVGKRLDIELTLTDKLILSKSNKCIPVIKEY